VSDLEAILNWWRIDARISTSGQPGEAELAMIAAAGVRWGINLGLHSHEKALPDEAGSVARLGMTYVHIPVDFRNPLEEDFDMFCAALAACGKDKVHVHCIMNYRVSAFFYRFRRDVLGMDEALARAEMERIWRPDAVWSAFAGLR